MAVRWPKTPVGAELPLSVSHPPNLGDGAPGLIAGTTSLPREVPNPLGGMEGLDRRAPSGHGSTEDRGHGSTEDRQPTSGGGDGTFDDGAMLSEDIELDERLRASEDVGLRVRFDDGLERGEQMV